MAFDVSFLDLDVDLNVTPDGELDVRIVANADLYEPETVGLIADAFNAALDAFATMPDCPLSTLELLPPADLDLLLAPATPAAVERSQPVASSSLQTEQALIAMLEELLDITGVDREDNFFALGGDSIISVQWSARATARGLALTPAMVFEHMTIAELAAAVDAAADQLAVKTDSATVKDSEPINASGLDADALAALAASWLNQS
jgi:mycobactin peptide synthetase MbtE